MPQRNALDRAAQLKLQDVLKQGVGRYAAIILSGAGSSFCAGLDSEGDAPETDFSRQGNTWIDTIEAIRKHPSVMIAAVNGEALGDGVSLINACDLAMRGRCGTLPDISAPHTRDLGARPSFASFAAGVLVILTGKRIAGHRGEMGIVNVAGPPRA